jgi:hypothetical protein
MQERNAKNLKCKAQMRIIAFIQDAHSIKDIMKAHSSTGQLHWFSSTVTGQLSPTLTHPHNKLKPHRKMSRSRVALYQWR